MSKQSLKFWVYSALGLLLAGILFGALGTPAKLARFEGPPDQLTIVSNAGGDTNMRGYRIDVARTPEQQQVGLMYRDTIASDYGMLFIYPVEMDISMWMKNTRIPLDMLFINSHGIITHIHEMAKPFDETPIPSGGKARAVLELKGGEVAAKGIRKGDQVRYPDFTP